MKKARKIKINGECWKWFHDTELNVIILYSLEDDRFFCSVKDGVLINNSLVKELFSQEKFSKSTKHLVQYDIDSKTGEIRE